MPSRSPIEELRRQSERDEADDGPDRQTGHPVERGPVDAEREARLRREAMAWLTVRTHGGATSTSSPDLLDVCFDGEQFRLLDTQRGVHKPAGFGAALSIPHRLRLRRRTTFPLGHRLAG